MGFHGVCSQYGTGRAHPSRRDEQHWESRAMLFIEQLDIISLKYWQVCFFHQG